MDLTETIRLVRIMGFWYTFFGGHVSFWGITIFGANAMNWAVNIETPRWCNLGRICFTLPVLARWRKNSRGQRFWQWYFYLSPNCTPWASTFYRGSDKEEVIRAQIRRLNFGHGFNSEKHREALYALNHKFSWFRIGEYDIEQFGLKPEYD